jgi:hypothetical protein
MNNPKWVNVLINIYGNMIERKDFDENQEKNDIINRIKGINKKLVSNQPKE